MCYQIDSLNNKKKLWDILYCPKYTAEKDFKSKHLNLVFELYRYSVILNYILNFKKSEIDNLSKLIFKKSPNSSGFTGLKSKLN